MRRTGSHEHHCVNKWKGCRSTRECSNRHLESWPDEVCTVNPANQFECHECQTAMLADAAEMLWVVLASVNDWTDQSPEWQEAAARWRDNYFAAMKQQSELVL